MSCLENLGWLGFSVYKCKKKTNIYIERNLSLRLDYWIDGFNVGRRLGVNVGKEAELL